MLSKNFIILMNSLYLCKGYAAETLSIEVTTRWRLETR